MLPRAPRALLLVSLAPLLLIAYASLGMAQPTRTVILVRHAERAGGTGADVGISQAGQCRAETLARMLADAGLTSIYTSEVARTQQTAEPLAKKMNIRPTVIPAKDVDALIQQLRAGASGGPALVVGHSNTVPEIVARLAGKPVPPIGDGEFDRMYIVTLLDKRKAAVTALRYPGCP